jgi:hypothetical protein
MSDVGDEFGAEMREAMQRRPAPPGLKRKVMEQRTRQRTLRLRSHTVLWQRLAACLVFVGVLAGAFEWRQTQERRRGEEARQQVLTALRITSHALDTMKAQLAAHDRDGQE